MFNQYIEYPYIVFPFGSAKPALVITIAYICILTVLIWYGIRKNKLKLTIRQTSKMKRGEQSKFIISIVGFVIMLASCIAIPSFLDSDNIILNVSNAYLKFEPLIYLISLLFLCSTILNKANPDKQIKASNTGLNLLVWVSIFTGIITQQLDYTFWQNILVLIGAGTIIVLFLIIDIEAVSTIASKEDKFDMIPYAPVQSAEELFPQHRMHANDIANIIFKSSSEPFSICISGEWGTGKTSVVHGVIDILKSRGADSYEFIHINALELDNKQALMHYLFSRIKEILKARGVYVGIDSEFKDFISSSTGALTSDSIGTLIHKKFFHENDDYRIQKEKLEKVLQRAFGQGKLIVIVDDIERCERTIAREYLFLIKEVATMQNCVSIFVTDYNMLNEIVYIDDSNQQQLDRSDFLSKFFNYRIDLRKNCSEEIFEFYDNYFKPEDPAFQAIYEFVCMSPATWCQKIISGINSKLEEEKNNKKKYWADNEREKEYDKRITILETRLNLFNSLINNPRNVVKFYNVFRNNILVCNKKLYESGDKLKTKKYIDSRNIGQALYVLTFAEIFLPFEHQRIIERGAKYIEQPLYGTNEIVSEERALLIEITEGIVYGEYSEYEKLDGYIIQDVRNFIETFLSNKNNLPNLINIYSSNEEKWMAAIEECNAVEIEHHWLEMVLMILQKNPYVNSEITNEKRAVYFAKLLIFAEQQIKTGNWPNDTVFSIFDSDMKTDRLFSMGKGMLTTFWDHLQKSTVYRKPSENLVKSIKMFPYHYTFDRMNPMYRLSRYLMPYENDNEDSTSLREHMLNINKKYEDNISLFMEKLVQYIPDCQIKGNNRIERYSGLAKQIVDYLNQQNMLKYPDVKNDIELMLDSITEFSSLEGIINWVEEVDSGAFYSSFTKDTIEQTIQHFETVLISPSQDIVRDLEHQFLDFFKWLQNEQGNVIDNQQIERLHNLVTLYTDLTGYSSLPYRRLLLNIAAKQNLKETDATTN